MHQSRPDVIAIQETWLDGSIPDNDLSINNHSIIRRDRNINGGGVAFYVNHRLDWSIPDLKLSPEVECLCIDVHHGSKTTRICNFYRPESPSSWFRYFENDLEEICETSKDAILMGDFNIDFLRPAECRAFNTTLNAFDLVRRQYGCD